MKWWHDNTWKTLSVTLVGHGSESADISVLAADIQLSGDLPLVYSSAEIYFGQEVYFLGFPYGLTAGGEEINRSFPLPFVKRGLLSGTVKENRLTTFLLDGHNNKGFSGGPVVFKRADGKLAVTSVISGFKSVYQEVLDKNGNQTNLLVPVNIGVIESHGIKHAIEAIESNPIGIETR